MNTNANLQRLKDENEVRAAAMVFAQEHQQDPAEVVKLDLSWFDTAQLHPDWAHRATYPALHARL